jgi:hypothetical protein
MHGMTRTNMSTINVDDIKLTPYRETIWHFSCDHCYLWWSFATMDAGWLPKEWYCPHCGMKHYKEK